LDFHQCPSCPLVLALWTQTVLQPWLSRFQLTFSRSQNFLAFMITQANSYSKFSSCISLCNLLALFPWRTPTIVSRKGNARVWKCCREPEAPLCCWPPFHSLDSPDPCPGLAQQLMIIGSQKNRVRQEALAKSIWDGSWTASQCCCEDQNGKINMRGLLWTVRVPKREKKHGYGCKFIYKGQIYLVKSIYKEIVVVTQWQRACLACARPWIPSPELPKRESEREKEKEREYIETCPSALTLHVSGVSFSQVCKQEPGGDPISVLSECLHK
jgi:hypothetical protein